jgi:enediyne biosynthesis protein E4
MPVVIRARHVNGPGAGGVAVLLLMTAFVAGTPHAASSPWPVEFLDIASEAGLRHPTIYGDVDRKRFIIETNGCGLGLIDVDEDGWLDLVLLNGTRLEAGTRRARTWPVGESPTLRLYRNAKGRFIDVTKGSGLERVGWGSSVCAGDFDRDGRVDLFVTYFGRNVLYRNLGGARFQDVTAAAGLAVDRDRWGSGCSFLDADRDGDHDLFVANYLAFDLASAPEPGQGANCFWKGVPVNCGPKGLPTDTNLFYVNNGDGTFTDRSEASGIGRVTGRYSMTAAAADYDGDGWIDIYVASDSTAAILYRNNRDGTFTDVALESGSAYSEFGAPQAGMGLAVADYDGNGWLDILKTHFADDIPALYRNLGKGTFEDAASEAGLGVQNRYVQWGAGMPDVDNDGRPDVFIVTGNVYPEVEARLPDYPHRSPRLLFRNVDGRRFVDASRMSGPAISTATSSRGAAFGDIDNDGDVDALIMNMNATPSLLRNEQSGSGNWLIVRLVGPKGNAQGIGATVRVTAGGRTQTRAVLSQASYYSVDDLRPHFGLGAAAAVDRVEVRWPDGAIGERSGIAVNQIVTVAR